jgi:hypothetical protein
VGKSVVATKRFEAWREGLEDVAYMDMLQKAIAAAEAKGKNVSDARALLDGREKVLRARNQQALESWRLSVGRTIDKLKK